MSEIPDRFTISLAEQTLDDLRERLARTRWPDVWDPSEEYYGTSVSYLQELVTYWLEKFDWRAAEARINEYTHHRVDVGGVPVHFIREPGTGPNPIPLILSHGWPWGFWEWSKVIRPLADPGAYGGDPADAFDVIVPSIPGFGFSTPVPGAMNFWKMADVLHALMTEHLGYEKYAAGGADYGAWMTGQLGHKYAADLYGIWLGHAIPLDLLLTERPWDCTGGAMVPEGVSPEIRAEILKLQDRYAGHVAAHILDPQNLSFGLADSPVGMLAWILRRWTKWSDCHGDVESVFPRDHLLTNATMWWATGAISSSIRAYADVVRYPWTPSHDRKPIVEAPAGFTFLEYENPPGVTTENRVQAFLGTPGESDSMGAAGSMDGDWFNPVYAKAHTGGGHFTPWENPEAVIEDIRTTFRKLR